MSWDADPYEYELISDEYDEVVRDYVQYSFWPEEGAQVDGWTLPPPHDELGEQWGLFRDGELLSINTRYFVDARIRGDWHPIDATSTIVTPPEHRRQGAIARMAPDHYQRCREEGLHFSFGWAFDHGFYHQFGYGKTDQMFRYTCSPGALLSAVEDPDGRFRRVGPDAWADLDAVYREYVDDLALPVDRTEEWWRTQIFAPTGTTRHACVWERDGEPRGYVVYEVRKSSGRVIDVQDMGYVDHEAFRHLVRYLGQHDAQIGEVRLILPEDRRLLDVVDSPESLDCSIKLGPVFRVLNVAAGLESLSYPRHLDGTVTVAVSDSLAFWNDDTFALSFDGGTATCEPTDREADVSVDVKPLSELVVGYRSVEELERTGGLTVHDDDGAALLAAAFPPQTSFVYDDF
ncbi:hypothetical protein BRC81_15305 [Halobacteriales archaeon QS_1_68_20]|nr:MAG: hypothetical protein BRC81_15305 [Halobacteriales archaeon QS_1_68_20]